MINIDKLHWINKSKTEDNTYDMVLDHNMLSSWRMCQAHFELTHVHGYQPKLGRSWSLEFGILMHQVIEEMYQMRKANRFDLMLLTATASILWDRAGLDVFAEHRTFKALGGKMGFMALCHQYASYYSQDSERLRIIDTEITFGSNKEVFLGTIVVQKSSYELYKINCYLSGRIDFLADDGIKIGPVDHKTRAVFTKVEHILQYNPHEGITGYIYAIREIMKKHYPDMYKERKCNSAWINFIQVQNEPDPLKRFKRGLVMRTDYQLEQYKLRQLETFRDLFNYVMYARVAQWNTEACTHWYGTNCTFHAVHRQPDDRAQLTVLQSDYTAGKFWNPETIDEERKQNNDRKEVSAEELSAYSSTNETAVQE